MGVSGRQVRQQFLKLPINFSVITNLDYEHLDYYKSFEKLEVLLTIFK